MKIFVQITSYRDPELVPTIIDCIKKSKNPNSLHFGICWQHDEKEDLKEFEINPKFRIADFSWKDSKGAGWAKSIAQKLYNDEDYTLQIDSHHRFEKNWDEILIKLIEESDKEKPIISSFAGAYRTSNNEKLNIEPYKISITGFDEEDLPILRPDYINNWEENKALLQARFLCGHYIFARGSFCREYEYDPDVYFEGLDVSLSARCYTMGYTLLHPPKSLIWHEYTRENRNKHWLDHTEALKEQGVIEKSWSERDELSKKRVRQLLGIKDHGIDLGKYGLGSSKSIRQYEMYIGVDFAKQLLHPAAVKGDNPYQHTDEEAWKKELVGQSEPEELSEYSLEIDWDADEIEKADDYEFWFFGFHDEDGKEIYRNDFNKQKDPEILSFKKTNVSITFKSKKQPKSCIIWPYSKSKGWLTRLETKL